MTSDRLYYNDSYLTTFSATLAEADPEGIRVVLGHSAFYPASGGQPFDTGTIAGIEVSEVQEDDTGRVIHTLSAPLPAAPGDAVTCQVDRTRRLDHMQQHTGQHLLSAVLAELAGAPTLSFHMGAEVSTIELGVPALDSAMLERAELRSNELIAENRPVSVSYEDASEVQGLRKASEREGTLRIVSIEGLDRSACGGTHVRATGEIGCILLRGTEKIRGNVRLEFVCGLRATRRARADFNALTTAARTLGSALDEVPRLTASALEKLADAEKQKAKLALEIARMRGTELWRSAEPAATGLRIRAAEAANLGDETRAEAQSFVAGGKAVYLAWCASPASVLLACSADSGLHAGNIVKSAVTAHGGRGGGAPQMAQGGAPVDVQTLVDAINTAVPR